MSFGDSNLSRPRSISRSGISLRINDLAIVFLWLALHPARGEIYGGNPASVPKDNQYADAQERLASVAEDIRNRLSSLNYRAILVPSQPSLFSYVAEATD